MKSLNRNTGACIMGAVIVATLSACNDFLDKLPDNRTELTDASSVSSLLVSAYPQEYPAYLLEMESDNTDENISTSWTEADILQHQAYRWEDISETTDESPQSIWEACYSAVAAANQALEYIASQDSSQYLPQLREALLCRAYAEFTLSTVFCNAYDAKTAAGELGLPYPTTPETHVGEKYQRGTLLELYRKIDADIQEALPLDVEDYTSPKFHFNKAAAYAFATRFYLYYKEYDKAVQYATLALGSDPTAKLRDWAAWDALSENDLIRPNAYDNSSVAANFLILSVYSQWGVISGPYLYGDKFAHNTLISKDETVQSTGPWGSYSNTNYGVFYNDALSKVAVRKIGYYFEYTDKESGIGYYHAEFVPFNAEETLLCRAEAYAIQGLYQKAVDDINSLLSSFEVTYEPLTLDGIRSYYNSISYYTPTDPTPKKRINVELSDSVNKEPLIQCILHLRRILTIHDGLRMQDIKRYGIVIYRRQVNTNGVVSSLTDSLGVDDPRRAIQLPADVITAGMQANPRNE